MFFDIDDNLSTPAGRRTAAMKSAFILLLIAGAMMLLLLGVLGLLFTVGALGATIGYWRRVTRAPVQQQRQTISPPAPRRPPAAARRTG